jgi:hypothetical protein
MIARRIALPTAQTFDLARPRVRLQIGDQAPFRVDDLDLGRSTEMGDFDVENRRRLAVPSDERRLLSTVEPVLVDKE